MSKKREIIKQAGIYSGSTQIAQIITLITAILFRRFLGPMQTGIWTTLQILVDYSKYATFGVMDAVNREIPYQVGKKDENRATEIKNLAFSFVISSSILVSGGIALFALLMRNHFSQEVFAGLLMVSGVIVLQRINNLMVSVLRCYKKFDVEASLTIVSAIVNGVFVASLSYFFKIYGFIWAMILSLAFNIVFLRLRHNYQFQWNLSWAKLKPLVAFGAPLMALGLLTTFLRSFDKIVIAKFLGFEAMGHYSIAQMACSYVSNFAISVAIVLLPHFQEKFGEKDDPKALGYYLFKSSLAYALTVPAFLGAAWIFGPYAIHLLLPKFIPGIPAMKILILSMFFIALFQPYYDFLITIKKHLILFPALGLIASIAVGIQLFVVKAGYGIEGVAGGVIVTYFLAFTLLYICSLRHFSSIKEGLFHYTSFILPFLYFGISIYLITHIFFSDDFSAKSCLFRLLAFSLTYLPLLWVLKNSLKSSSSPAQAKA